MEIAEYEFELKCFVEPFCSLTMQCQFLISDHTEAGLTQGVLPVVVLLSTLSVKQDKTFHIKVCVVTVVVVADLIILLLLQRIKGCVNNLSLYNKVQKHR